MGRLTNVKVQKLKTDGYFNDGSGLYLRVRNGAKSWVLRTRVQGKKEEIGLGGFSVVSLAEARADAARLRAVARKGGNPRAHRDRKILTFGEAAKLVHAAQIESTSKNAKHRGQWINTLEQYANPTIGERPIDQVGQPEILKVLQPIWLEKPETARRVRQRLRTVFAWARTAGHREAANPVDDIEQGLPSHKKKAGHFPALPWSDVPAFVAQLHQSKAISALALRFAILTCARSGEVRGAEWSEIDVEERVWTIPGERMKAGVEHRVPLTADALAILSRVAGLDARLVFPGTKRDRPMSDMTLAALLKRMNRANVTVHGFRSTFRDWVSDATEFPGEIAEHCLAHKVGGAVQRAYARSDLFEKRRRLLEAWAEYCAK